ncbi:MAG: DMT family transporter [Acidimicrobiales bacterium]
MLAVVLALAAALCNALATIFERMGVQNAPREDSMHLSLIAHAVRRRVWLLGFAAMIAAFAFQVSALSQGGLTVVQPLLATELIFLVVILRAWFGRPFGRREATGLLLTVAGLATFLAVSDQGGGTALPNTAGWVIVSAACAGLVVAAVLLARTGSRPWRSACFGTAAAVSFALCAAFMKSSTTIAARVGDLHLFEHFEPYALAAAGLCGLFLAQNAFHAGPITASQASLVIVDPIVSIVIGVGLFNENVRDSTGALALDAVALLVMSLGLLVLCHSPLIVGHGADEPLVRAPASG